MKIKLDENLPFRPTISLLQLGHDVDTVHSEGFAGSRDEIVWEAAQKNQRFFITQELDFSDFRKFVPGTHYGILLVRLRQPGRQALIDKIEFLFETEDVDRWNGCIIVATDYKIRIRRPDKMT
jgi:predicted nuclease of predicted toxin-antitoxin system